MSKITDYLKETRAELKHVSWPSRRQASVFTVVVIAVSILTAAYLGAFDYIFSHLIKVVI
jgi:preprotein translocase subunit SecE